MNIVKCVKELNLPSQEYVVFGSGPLHVHRIRETKDIELFVSESLWKRLLQEGFEECEHESTFHSKSTYLKKGLFEVVNEWDYGAYDPTLQELIRTAEIIDGVPFASLDEVVKWKRVFGREKDMRDIALVEDYLNKGI